MASLRTFIGIAISPDPALRRVIRSLGEMGTAIKPVARDGLHLTLKFLGDTPQEQVPQVLTVVQEAAAGFGRFTLRLAGLSAFPNTRRPSVVWVGVEDAEPLIAIAGELEARLEPLGYEPEGRDFTPHLTIARVRRKPPPALFEMFEGHEATEFGEVPVQHLTYYESSYRDGRQSGPAVYAVLGTGDLLPAE